MSSTDEFNKVIKMVVGVAKRNGIKNSYIVGGYPRAVIMDKVTEDAHDLDFASAWPGEATKLGALAAAKMYDDLPNVFHRTGTIQFEYNGIELEFQGSLGSIADNQPIIADMEKFGISVTPLTINIYARDFTINTLILDLNDMNIYDITGYAIKDIRNGIIRTPLDSDMMCNHNPLIMLRAIRFALRYNFQMDRRLKSSIRKYKDRIRKEYTAERLQIEILKMLKNEYDGTIHMMKDFEMDDLLSNEDYDIFEVLSGIDITNFEGDLDDLIQEKSQ
jgi:tRNA nucleotidyltransferase/poly(A) polymerase